MSSVAMTKRSAGYVVPASEWNQLIDNDEACAAALMQAAADLFVGTGSRAGKRLAKGTAHQVLRVNSGATDLEWASNPVIDAETTNVDIGNTSETEIFTKSITLDANDLVDLWIDCKAVDSGAGGITVKVYSGSTLLATVASNAIRGDGITEVGMLHVQVLGTGSAAQRVIVEGALRTGTSTLHSFVFGGTGTASIDWASAADLKVKITLGHADIAFSKYSSIYAKYTV